MSSSSRSVSFSLAVQGLWHKNDVSRGCPKSCLDVGMTEDPPWSADLDPRRLLVFRLVAHEGSLTGAARVLGWTQPAVSQHVQRLERELGLPLVRRVARGVVLTEPGVVLLRHADAVAASLVAAGRAMDDLSGLRSGRVRLAAFPSAAATLVTTALAGAAADHPGLDVRLVEVEPPEAVGLLARGEVDLAIVFEYPDVPTDVDVPATGVQAHLVRVPLLDDPVRLVLPRGHPAAGPGSASDDAPDDDPGVALADLAGERWIAGCLRCRQHLLASAAREGFVPDVRHSTDDYVVVQALVAAGLAVAALPGLALAASRRPDVVVRPIVDHPPRAVTALLAADAEGVPAVAAVLGQLRRAATESGRPSAQPLGAGASVAPASTMGA